MDPKSVFTSKTLWVNVLAIGAGFLAPKLGVTISAEDQVAALGVINLILRMITKQPIAWTSSSS